MHACISLFRHSIRVVSRMWPLVLLAVLSIAGSALAQAPLTPFQQQSVLAFNPGAKPLKTLMLSGSATWIAGSLKESGDVLLKVSTDGSTEEQWTLPTTSHSYTESSWAAGRSCTHIDKAGKQRIVADPSCFRRVPWFAPWLGFTLLPSAVVLAKDGTQSTDRADGNVRFTYLTNLTPPPALGGVTPMTVNLMQQGTTVSVLYDHTTALPVSLEYDYMVNSDSAYVIKNRIVFSDYHADAGFVLPHRIQRYVQRTLQADITINSVTAE